VQSRVSTVVGRSNTGAMGQNPSARFSVFMLYLHAEAL
jgi:hypothetical protein